MTTLNAFGFATRKQRNHNVPAKVKMNVNPSVAFIQPVDNSSFQFNNEIIKKPNINIPQPSTTITTTTRKTNTIRNTSSKKTPTTNKNTITNYFTQQTNMDVEMEEPTANEEEEHIVCVIRKKLPMTDMWNFLQNEYAQDPLFEDDDEDDDCYEEEPPQQIKEINNNNNRGRCRRYSEVEQDTTPSLLKRQKTVDTDLSDVMSRFLNLQSRIKPPPLQQASCIQVMNEFVEEEQEDLTRVLRYKMTIEESHLFVLNITQEFLY